MPVPSAAIPAPVNEPIKTYAPGTPERAAQKAALASMAKEPVVVPMRIGAEDVTTARTQPIPCPHDRSLTLGEFHLGDASSMTRAIDAAITAQHDWAAASQAERSAVFLKAAELATTTHRARLNASTMLGQSKTVFQAEIDSACELADFLRFNAAWANRLVEAPVSPANTWNTLESRPLEGFVLAVTPFNFTAIAGNLPSAPALLGNVAVWKPSPLAMRSAFEVMNLFRAAGLPDGVINFVQGDAPELVATAVAHPSLAGVHFTGSTSVFREVWRNIGSKIDTYKNMPRLVGETGGKDFVFAHPSADREALAVALVRGAFEYQGQKCSAASRAYVPRSMWKELSERLVALVKTIRMGDVSDFRTFMGAVIDQRSFDKLSAVQAEAKSRPEYEILTGGGGSAEAGFFVEATIVVTTDPNARLMRDEFFGPILCVYVYDDAKIEETLSACDAGSPYALTGAIFSQDRAFLTRASAVLKNAAGNLYFNDKPTGAVVGQQPFGGARASGTNDKAGSVLNLLRWMSPRTIKETFVPPTSIAYPSMDEA